MCLCLSVCLSVWLSGPVNQTNWTTLLKCLMLRTPNLATMFPRTVSTYHTKIITYDRKDVVSNVPRVLRCHGVVVVVVGWRHCDVICRQVPTAMITCHYVTMLSSERITINARLSCFSSRAIGRRVRTALMFSISSRGPVSAGRRPPAVTSLTVAGALT